MTFEFWDTVTQNIIGVYDTQDNALAVVATVVRAHGPAYADTIALVHVDPDGDVHTLATGPDLARRAEAPHSQPVSGSSTDSLLTLSDARPGNHLPGTIMGY